MEVVPKRKVTARVNHGSVLASSPRLAPLNITSSRPSSPSKPSSPAPGATFRPKAKVNSSAQSNLLRKPSSVVSLNGRSSNSTTSQSSSSRTNASITPRALSPARRPQSVVNEPRANSGLVHAKLTPKSVPGSPNNSLQNQASASPSSPSLHARTVSTSSPGSSPPTHVIKAKLTPHHPDSLHPSPSFPGNFIRARAPSVSTSSLSSNSQVFEHQPYPITTSTPAANPHRYATARASPSPPNRHQFQNFSRTHDDLHIPYNRRFSAGGTDDRQTTTTSATITTRATKVDPTTIPSPAHSPPASAVSYSSRSSVSRSSASFGVDFSGEDRVSDSMSGLGTNGSVGVGLGLPSMTSREDNLSRESETDRMADGEVDNVGRKVRAEAKTNRKIADLEITNRSLLSINSTLEETKHQQAKEIRELRRKLRESMLMLPPRTYRAVKSSLGPEENTADDDDDDESDVNDDDVNFLKEGDDTYKRVSMILSGLIEAGNAALVSKPGDFYEGGKGGAKVLSAEEVRNWADSSGHSRMETGDSKDGRGADPLSPSLIAIPDSDGIDSEDELGALTSSGSRSISRLPPIHITESA